MLSLCWCCVGVWLVWSVLLTVIGAVGFELVLAVVDGIAVSHNGFIFYAARLRQ